jgi:hypothetical protein
MNKVFERFKMKDCSQWIALIAKGNAHFYSSTSLRTIESSNFMVHIVFYKNIFKIFVSKLLPTIANQNSKGSKPRKYNLNQCISIHCKTNSLLSKCIQINWLEIFNLHNRKYLFHVFCAMLRISWWF